MNGIKPYNIDSYFQKKSIKDFLENSKGSFKGDFLDVGCGKMPYKDLILEQNGVEKYIGLDIEQALVYDDNIRPDYTWDGITMPFKNNSFDSIMATEVLEHCPDIDIIIGEIFRVLKPGGGFFFTIPYLWPLHEVPHDEYRYTPFSLKRIFLKHGFKSIKINASGGWNAALGQMLGLWLLRSGKMNLTRKVLIRFMLPFISWLYKSDVKPREFVESTMITGITGVCLKKG